jgi:O-methyltransferase
MRLDPNSRLKPVSALGGHFNVINLQKFEHALKLLKESLFDKGASLYSSDNLITWNRNLSFLRDERFVTVLEDPSVSETEKSIVWRTYILLYFAKISLNVEGDFVECGCHTGFTVHEVVKNLDLIKHQKKYWLYDLFEWNEGDEHSRLEGHQNPKMYEDVVTRFSKFPNIKIIKGSVPESFSDGFPDAISFCHIDMNHPAPEAGALKAIIPKLTKGGVIVFDDYGWWGYSAQKIALDPIADFFEQEILELPTGQAILIKV